MKLVGAALLVSAGLLAGISKSMEQRRKICVMDDMVRALGIISAEISFRAMPLPEIFSGLAEGGPKLTRDFFEILRQHDGVDPGKLWSEAVAALFGNGEAVDMIEALAHILGRFDADDQIREIEKARAALAAAADAERNKTAQKLKNYPALGFCAGAVVAILLI